LQRNPFLRFRIESLDSVHSIQGCFSQVSAPRNSRAMADNSFFLQGFTQTNHTLQGSGFNAPNVSVIHN